MKFKEERYSHGRFFVRPDLDSGNIVREFVQAREFLDTNALQPVAVTNRRNRLYKLNLGGVSQPLMLKVNWINPEFSLSRRIALYLNSRFKHYPRRGYAGAMALEQAQIPGMRAVAYWNYNPRSFKEQGYYLYEEIDADFSVVDYQLFARRDAEPSQQQVFNRLIGRVATLVGDLHRANLRHGSVELGNFLVKLGCPMERADVASVDHARIYLIDTDRMTRTMIRNPWFKRVFDVRDLCRINIDRAGREYLLRCYLGDEYSSFWQRALEFWYSIHVGTRREYRENHPDLAQPRL